MAFGACLKALLAYPLICIYTADLLCSGRTDLLAAVKGTVGHDRLIADLQMKEAFNFRIGLARHGKIFAVLRFKISLQI